MGIFFDEDDYPKDESIRCEYCKYFTYMDGGYDMMEGDCNLHPCYITIWNWCPMWEKKGK